MGNLLISKKRNNKNANLSKGETDMLKKVKLKDGRYGWIEKYLPNGMCIIRFADGWGWIKESAIEKEE